jgi:hypothetical protein
MQLRRKSYIGLRATTEVTAEDVAMIASVLSFRRGSLACGTRRRTLPVGLQEMVMYTSSSSFGIADAMRNEASYGKSRI